MKTLILSIFLCVVSFTVMGANGLKQVGTYLLEYSIFKIDVYQITYSVGENYEELLLDYKIDVKREHSLEGWKVGLKHKLQDKDYKDKIQWLFDNTVDMKKGDRFRIAKKNGSLEFTKNNEQLAQTSDPKILELAFEPWLGEKPVDEKLKASLLGKP